MERIPNESLEIVEVKKISDCKEVGKLYKVKREDVTTCFVFKYEDITRGEKLVYALELSKGQEEGADCWEVVFYPIDFGYIDMGGINVFKYGNNLRKVVGELLAHDVNIRKLRLQHFDSFVEYVDLKVILRYLNFKQKIGDQEDLERVLNNFLKKYSKDKKRNPVLDNLFEKYYKIMSNEEVMEEARDKSHEKRFQVFYPITKRVLRGLPTTFKIIGVNDFEVEFK